MVIVSDARAQEEQWVSSDWSIRISMAQHCSSEEYDFAATFHIPLKMIVTVQLEVISPSPLRYETLVA